jgi:hypothetical protein
MNIHSIAPSTVAMVDTRVIMVRDYRANSSIDALSTDPCNTMCLQCMKYYSLIL